MFAQLDAVGNQLSRLLPFPFYTAVYAVTAFLAVLAYAGDRGTRLSAVPAQGARFAGAFLLWACVTWLLSKHQDAGWSYLLGLAKSMGLLVLVMMLADTRERLYALLGATIAAGLVSALIVYGDVATGSRLVSTSVAAVTAEFGGVARSAGGSDENPTTAAHMLLVSTVLLLGLAAAGTRFRFILLAAALVCTGALALMGARSALIGFAAAMLLILATFRGHRAFPLLVGLTVAAGAGALLLAPSTLERLMALANWSQDPTLYRRAAYLVVGADLLHQSPMWGVGPGNFPLYFVGDEYRFLPGRPPVPRELHNTYLDVAVETGLIGFVLFASVIARSVAGTLRAWRSRTALSSAGMAITAAWVALLVASFFMPNKDLRYLWLLVGASIQCGRLAAQGRAAA
jgi:hypothetical protein